MGKQGCQCILDCPWSASAGEIKLNDTATGKGAAAPTSPPPRGQLEHLEGGRGRLAVLHGDPAWPGDGQQPELCLSHRAALKAALLCERRIAVQCPQGGRRRWQDTCAHDITGRAQAVLVQPGDAVSAAIDVRVPWAEGGTDVPACAGCPGIVDCARGFTLLTPGPTAAGDTSDREPMECCLQTPLEQNRNRNTWVGCPGEGFGAAGGA